MATINSMKAAQRRLMQFLKNKVFGIRIFCDIY